MRRAILFILLFSCGFVLLMFVDRSRRLPAGEGQEVQVAPIDEALSGVQTVEVTGYTKLEFFDAETGLVLRQFEAEDLQPKGEGLIRPYLATKLTVTEFMQGSTDLLRLVEAESADLVLDLGGGFGGPRLGDGSLIQLHNVVLRQLRDIPQAPLTISAPEVAADLDRQVFITPDDFLVRVKGDGLSAEGRGMKFESREGRLEFPRGGTFDLVREGSQRGVLSTAEGTPLILERQGGVNGDRFEIVAEGPSVLVIVQEEELQVDAQHLRIKTRMGPSGVEADQIVIRGPVVITQGGSRFGGVDAIVLFQADGSLRFLVDREPWIEFGTDESGDGLTSVVMRGEGTLWAIHQDKSVQLGMDGPVRFSGPGGVSLEAQSGFRGRVLSELSRVKLDLLGAVFVSREGLRLSTNDAVVTVQDGENSSIHLSTTEPLQVLAEDASGVPFSFEADGGGQVIVTDNGVQVPHAFGVRAQQLGDPLHSLVCVEVLDLSENLQTFTALGDVQWSGPEGSGSAERMVSNGVEIELEGKPGVKASLAWIGEGNQVVELEAQRLVFSKAHAEAWGDVRGDIQLETSQLGLKCDHTRIDLEGTAYRWVASQVSEGVWSEKGSLITLAAQTLEARWVSASGPDGSQKMGAPSIEATGDVRADIIMGSAVSVEADILRVVPGESVLLEAHPGRKITASGILPGTELPFRVTGTSLRASPDRLTLERVKGVIEGGLLPVAPGNPEGAGATRENTDFGAQLFVLTRTSLELKGAAMLETADLDGNPLTIASDRIATGYRLPAKGEDFQPTDIQFIEATGDVRAVYGGLGRVEADSLAVNRERVALRGSPLLVRSQDFSFESTAVSVDLADYLVDAERGLIRQGLEWTLGFGGAAAVRSGPDLMQTMSGLLQHDLNETARADHVAIWLHPSRWRAMLHERLWGAPLELEYQEPVTASDPVALQETKLVNNTFQRLARGELSSFVRAIHLSGNIESEKEGVQRARAQEVYLDLENRKGWLKDAELGFEIEVGGRTQRLRAFSARLDSLPSGGLVASNATLTACDHEVPHYVIETSDLRLEPRPDGRWKFGVRGNRLVFPGGFGLPLPGIGSVVLDETGSFEGIENDEGEVHTIQNVFLSSTARFGTALGTAGATDIGSTGSGVAGVFGFDPKSVAGKWKYEGAWLGSRGPLLGLGLLLRETVRTKGSSEAYWLNLWARGAHDGGEDRGVVRVDAGETKPTRLWLNVRGRYPFDDRQWLDVVVNYQTDPGIQAEFYEREYLAYEERDTYLHWRKARDGHYFSGRLGIQGNSFQAAVLDSPTLGFYRGAAEIANLFGHSLLYSSSVDAAFLRRRAGDARFEAPFLGLDGNPDGLGDRDVVRVDTRHGLALPVALGSSGLEVVPSLDVQATSWDRSATDTQTVGRSGAFAGLEIGGSWARISDTSATSLAPYVAHTEELLIDEDPGQVVLFDTLDQPIGGSRSRAGIRMRWTRPRSGDDADVSLGIERLHGADNGQAQLDTGHFLARLGTTAFGMPVGIHHDGRYLLDESQTVYSKTTFAIKPWKAIEFQLSHDRGLGTDLATLYEAITYRGRISLDNKWEVDVLAQEAVFGTGTLRTEILLRRLGHDFVFEVGFFHREGEGSGVKVNLAPLLGWTRPRVSILSPR